MSLPEALVLGMLASTLGIVGDLWESALKRIGGVKDSRLIASLVTEEFWTDLIAYFCCADNILFCTRLNFSLR